jgi:hypothetical protein
MPGFDGTGPLGQGPMTGRGQGFCVLKVSEKNPGETTGFKGLRGVPVIQKVENPEHIEKEVITMPFGDGTGPAGLGPMTGRAAAFCAGFPVPGYINPIIGRAGFYAWRVPAARPYGAGFYGYGLPYGVRVIPGFGRRFGLGRGFGRGWGRGRRGHGRGRLGYR